MTSPTIGKVAFGPHSHQPLKSHESLKAEISRLRSANERLKGVVMSLQRDAQAHMVSLNEAGKFTMELSKSLADHKAELESARTQLDDAYKAIGLSNFSSEPLSCYLQRQREALKKAKCALDDVKAHEHVSPVLSYPCLFVLDDALTAINALNL